MSVLDKKYVIKLDLVKETYNKNMEFSISDLETSDFFITIKREGKNNVLDEEKQAVLYVVKPNGNIKEVALQYQDEMLYCNLTSELKNIEGKYIAQVVINNYVDGERLVVPSKFTYSVVLDVLDDKNNNVEEPEESFKEEYDKMIYNINRLDYAINDIYEVIDTHNAKFDEIDGLFLRQVQKHDNMNEIINGNTEKITVLQNSNIKYDESISILQQSHATQNERLNIAENTNNEQDGKLINIEDVITLQDEQLKTLENDNKTFNQEIGILENDVVALDTRLGKAEATITSYNSRIKSLESSHTSISLQLDNAKTINSSQNISISNINTKNITQDNRITALENKIAELEALIKTLQGGDE